MSHLTTSAAARRLRLKKALANSLYVRQDSQQHLVLVWFGDEYVEVFSEDGFRVSWWRVNKGGKAPVFDQVQRSMEDHIADGIFPDRTNRPARARRSSNLKDSLA